jgi:hypothetical protein
MQGFLANVYRQSLKHARSFTRPQPLLRPGTLWARGSGEEALLSIQQALWIDKAL